MKIVLFIGLLPFAAAGISADKKDYKDQFCTDPRTMRKHPAYSEWADAYSCTRHRCQPGGRNLAIYTVGCKRVEAPESAIECEEVVEDTNMQFPFCCTRLRCLVVVRGEVWTRVLGQPWEVLPAAPWSHMYKMKKPPPADTAFLPKSVKANEQGPVYELTDPEHEGEHEKVLRSSRKKVVPENPDDCNDVVPRAVPPPDIVIALSTSEDKTEKHPRTDVVRQKRGRKALNNFIDDEKESKEQKDMKETKEFKESREHRKREPTRDSELMELDEASTTTEKTESEEKTYGNAKPVTPRSHVAWTEIPQSQWNEHEGMDAEIKDVNNPIHDLSVQEDKIDSKDEKPGNFQALVNAIGTRMRDIENVVQRMSEKVHQVKPADADDKRASEDALSHQQKPKPKRPSSEAEDYRSRFSARSRSSKYIHSNIDTTSEAPLIVADSNSNGYFSDASNNVLRRSSPKEPASAVYMAPVEARRKSPSTGLDASEEGEKKKKKHSHKKHKSKGRKNKKHKSKEDKKKHLTKNLSAEVEKNIVASIEDSSSIVK